MPGGGEKQAATAHERGHTSVGRRWLWRGGLAISGLCLTIGAASFRYAVGYTVEKREKFFDIGVQPGCLRVAEDRLKTKMGAALRTAREPLATQVDATEALCAKLARAPDDPEAAAGLTWLRGELADQQKALAEVSGQLAALRGFRWRPLWRAAEPGATVAAQRENAWRPHMQRRPQVEFVLPLWVPLALGLVATGLGRQRPPARAPAACRLCGGGQPVPAPPICPWCGLPAAAPAEGVPRPARTHGPRQEPTLAGAVGADIIQRSP